MDGVRTLLFEHITGCEICDVERLTLRKGKGREEEENWYVIDIRELTANHNV